MHSLYNIITQPGCDGRPSILGLVITLLHSNSAQNFVGICKISQTYSQSQMQSYRSMNSNLTFPSEILPQ